MAENEMKFVHREETFNDHAVDEFADAQARVKSECKTCSHHKHFASCYLIGLLCFMLAWIMCATGHAIEYKEFFSPAEIAAAPAPKMKSKHKEVQKETEFAIVRILRMTRERISDVNLDGKTNCIDYALTFKTLWDRYYDPKDCIVIHNLNPNVGMSHLFVAVFDYKLFSYVDVEPWTSDLNRWQMVDVWKNLYDVYYNWYNQETRWMGEVRRKIR